MLHYTAVAMKYAKIEIEDKTLFVQTEAERMEKKGRESRAGTTEIIVLRGSVSAPRQREFVQLSKLAAIFNRTNYATTRPSCGTSKSFQHTI